MNTLESIKLVTEEVNNDIHNLGTKKERITRSRMRRIIFKIRDDRLYEQYDKDRAPGVKAIVERQFQKTEDGIMDFKNFTDVWDIHPLHTLQVVKRRDWTRAGGGHEKDYPDLLKPTAFTMQG